MFDSRLPRRLPALVASLGSLLIVLSACAGAGSGSTSESASASQRAASSSPSASEGASGPTITIASSTSFGTDEITVPAGETLTVVNDSGIPHTFTEGQDGTPVRYPRVNKQVPVGETIEVTFPEQGDYDMTCTFHPAMNMVVHVE